MKIHCTIQIYIDKLINTKSAYLTSAKTENDSINFVFKDIDLYLHLKCHSSTGVFQTFC